MFRPQKMKIENRFLFNFAVSYTGGGHKRLYEYAKWFNRNGGAWFVVHPNCAYLSVEFPGNRFFVVNQTKFQRLFSDCRYLEDIQNIVGQPDLYYAYGIPIYKRIGKINWFHLSNILPLALKNIPLSWYERLKMAYLGWRIRRNLFNANVISAESNYSLNVIGLAQRGKLFLSINGADDELNGLESNIVSAKRNYATLVGTYSYKGLDHAVLVFEMLKKYDPQLKLRIIGSQNSLTHSLREREDILVMGLLKQAEVIDCLRESKYYISTTYIENSYNAASEGIFLADESYISDIGPHQELLQGLIYEQIKLPSTNRTLLHVVRSKISGRNLKTWDKIIIEMIANWRVSMGNLK
jgi:glycosyltransferase involved in cell wall biosynthesis